MYSILEKVDQPQDLKKLSAVETERLADEIRQLIIHTVAKTGGHLAPNLGVVELTLALHRVFDSPRDKIVWDVGHQAYVHKILTGRRQQFNTLRTLGGLSGFPKRSESEHDAFGVGHSSTSISAALGIALARDIKQEQYQVLAVIGDGSLTGGQAFEALNHAGQSGTKLIVVLNDNEMSIAKNVGAMSDYLTKLRSDPAYSRMKRDIEYVLRRIPAIGDSVAKTLERAKDSLKYFLVPGMIFEDLGFTYIGPIDGHNVAKLCETFQAAKAIEGPVLVHVITQKGRGYGPAESNADKFHGTGPFCVDTGEIIKNSNTAPTYTSVFGQAMLEVAGQDPRIVAITAAMSEGTGLKSFAQKFPQRFFDVGIAEPHAVTLAAAMASQGMKPVVAIYSTFMQRAYDQIIHDICLQNLPVVLCLDRAGIVGEDGATHQGVFDLSYLRTVPNLTVMAPRDENELRHMLYTAIKSDSPTAIRYPRGSGRGTTLEPCRTVDIGKAEILKEGKDLALVAIGSMVGAAEQASDILSRQGISAGVVNARFVQPLDQALLQSLARKVGFLVTIEDNVLAGGFGAAVAEYVSDRHWYGVKLFRLGLPSRFIEHGKRDELLAKYGLNPEGIALQVERFWQEFGAK
ncbi:1-deoxy-D-xylulose-5-phosphate synthase [Acetonema longum]|uniref:1-deoxy-D-xylulose-5-phosphate synthase n=1 Tax=Acetonema longum DSM 6540 TaxID=1009370 RepID=F7NJY7_9FIRM|nr:1-deoxy-D-xylulose-5-phosphate synthase [Acetonema longum]EGO63634.1 deoxyxylulose-5-phosphate synthase [Acetonema longum DSM 6540]